MKLNNTATMFKKIFQNKLALTVALAVVSVTARAGGPFVVYAPYFNWDNNFNNSVFTWNSTAAGKWTSSFNFTDWNLHGYPATIRGWHYGWNPANDNLFPRQLSHTTSIPCTFSYTASAASGSSIHGDFAYDMFLRNDSAKSSPQLEMMVWAGYTSQAIGSLQTSKAITVNGVAYDLWYGDNTAAGYFVYSFVPNGQKKTTLPSGSSNVDLMKFFNYLKGKANFNINMYLDVVEAGCEVSIGHGSIASTGFSCTAN